ncbi:YdiK family protein [Bacillus sp. DJP31]|uniref:YdiK family protein n=1 Tax=Bacillus sp. DJP31 TaxID=3409789 RepID=UPI003BB5B612
MRTSPFIMGLLYLGMGIVFTVLAIQNKTETIWNFYTIVLILVATFDFGVSIRMFALSRKIKKAKK